MLVVHIEQASNGRIRAKSNNLTVVSEWSGIEMVLLGSRKFIVEVAICVWEFSEGMMFASMHFDCVCTTLIGTGTCETYRRCSWSLNDVVDWMSWKVSE